MTNAQLQALLNDVTVNPVVIPAGDIVIDTRLTVPRSNVTIQGAGPTTRLLLRGDNKLTEVTGTLSAQTPVNGLHASGLVTAGATNSLTVDDPTPYSATPGAINNTVFLRLGVSAADPHEAQDRAWAQIASITGNVLVLKNFYTGPTTPPAQFFMETIPTYSNSDLSWTTYPGRTGVYGTIPPDGGNLIARGYGTDHTLYTFSSLADNVTIQDLAVGLASDVGNAPLWTLGAKWCRNCLFQRITIEDFIGNAINAFESVGVTLDTYTIAAGRPGTGFPPIIFNSWGGRNVTFSNGTATVAQAQLIGTEGAKNVQINGLTLTTAHDPKGSATVPASFWTANGLGTGKRKNYPGTTIKNFTLNGVMNATVAWQKEDVDLTITDANLQATLGNNIDLRNFDGKLTINGVNYYPITNASMQITIPVIGAGGLTLVPLSQGLYRRARIQFANPNQYVQAGVGKIQYPSGNSVYTDGGGGHIPPANTWVELPNFYQVQSFVPSNLDTYFSTPKQLRCFGTPGAAATIATVDIDFWAPITRQFP